MVGLRGNAFSLFLAASMAPNMLPWSVMARAGIFMALAASTRASTLQAPSRRL
jgi:hypothetical protein